MARPKRFTLTPVANDVDHLSTADSITTPWALQLDGVLTFATPHPVTITVTSNESGETFTVTGTDRNGNVMTEDLAGPNNSIVLGTKNFATITSIVGTADATGVTAGVNGLCESGWYPLDYRNPDFNVAIGCQICEGRAGAVTKFKPSCAVIIGALNGDFCASGKVPDHLHSFVRVLCQHNTAAGAIGGRERFPQYLNNPIVCRAGQYTCDCSHRLLPLRFAFLGRVRVLCHVKYPLPSAPGAAPCSGGLSLLK